MKKKMLNIEVLIEGLSKTHYKLVDSYETGAMEFNYNFVQEAETKNYKIENCVTVLANGSIIADTRTFDKRTKKYRISAGNVSFEEMQAIINAFV